MRSQMHRVALDGMRGVIRGATMTIRLLPIGLSCISVVKKLRMVFRNLMTLKIRRRVLKSKLPRATPVTKKR